MIAGMPISKLVEDNILTSNEIYGDGYIETLGTSYTLYDDFYIEKHETSTFIDILDRIKESDTLSPSEESIIKWKEEVLASGFASFTYDW